MFPLSYPAMLKIGLDMPVSKGQRRLIIDFLFFQAVQLQHFPTTGEYFGSHEINLKNVQPVT